MADNGVQVRFGVRALQDSRLGGQMLRGEGGEHVFYDKDTYTLAPRPGQLDPWGSDILNRSINGYLKVGVPLNEDNSQNIALIADYSYQDMDSYFGSTKYLANQHSAFANLLYQNVISDEHKFTLGLNGTFDRYNEDFRRLVTIQDFSNKGITDLANAGVFGEYTYHAGDTFSAITGLRADWFSHVASGASRFRVSPRVTLKYSPVDEIVIRGN